MTFDHDDFDPLPLHRRSRPFNSRSPVAVNQRPEGRRFLQRVLPESWRFAQQMTLDLLRQVEFLAWSDRAEAFDTYFVRQAEAMMRPSGLTELVSGYLKEGAIAEEGRPQAERFAGWSRALVTAVLIELDERPEVMGPHQALTCLLSRDLVHARSAARWTGQHGMGRIAGALERLPGYALVLLASSPNDTAERFLARDAFWTAVMGAKAR